MYISLTAFFEAGVSIKPGHVCKDGSVTIHIEGFPGITTINVDPDQLSRFRSEMLSAIDAMDANFSKWVESQGCAVVNTKHDNDLIEINESPEA